MLDAQVRTGSHRGHWYFLTFTYHDGADWEPGDLKAWLQATRKRFQRKGAAFHYVWVAELQRRGAIHYHACVWVPRGMWIPKPDRSGLWLKGMSQIQKARNPVGYLAKYAGKGIGGHCDGDGRPHRFPRGARIQGAGGLTSASVIEARYWMAPRWVREAVGLNVVELRRVPGGWLNLELGEIYLSPWEFVGFTAGLGAALFRHREAVDG